MMGKKKKDSLAKDESRVELESLKKQLVRALADYDNLRKRVDKEKESWVRMASELVVSQFLPVLDTLEAAQRHLNDQGLGIAIAQFKEVLKEKGLEEIKPSEGDEFKAEIHEAIESVGGGEKGKIAELVLSGWLSKDASLEQGNSVLRYAKVKVFGDNVENEK